MQPPLQLLSVIMRPLSAEAVSLTDAHARCCVVLLTPSWHCPSVPIYSIKAQATVLELLESAGLPTICVTMALEEDAQRSVGEVLALAVKVGCGCGYQRHYWGGGVPHINIDVCFRWLLLDGI